VDYLTTVSEYLIAQRCRGRMSIWWTMNWKTVVFIVAPCILKIHWILHTNKCT